MKSLKEIYYFLFNKRQALFLEYRTSFKPRYGHGLPPHKHLYELINANREKYLALLTEFLEHQEALLKIPLSSSSPSPKLPCWNNGFLPGLDIVGLYGMINHFKPNRYVEVGAGNSTKVARLCVDNNSLDTKIISIDPAPRTEIHTIADELILTPFENTDLSLFQSLKENDIVFIDNSHRVLPNSDAMVFFMEVLPFLPKGVIVHVHDIYLPYDYPQFMCDRFYSEQYNLASVIMANPAKHETLLPNYFISEDEELQGILNPLWEQKTLSTVERHGGSFWFRIAR